MDLRRIINTPGIRALAHRTADGEPAIDHNPEAIKPELLLGGFALSDAAGGDVELLFDREPFDLRIVVETHGDTLVAVAVDKGSPICKSLPRLLRRAMKAKGIPTLAAPAPASTWVPATAAAPDPCPPAPAELEGVRHG